MPASSHPSAKLKLLLKSIIWDMDGVLVDTLEFQFEVWHNIFSEYGVEFDRANFNRHFGTTNLQTVQKTLGDRITPEEALAIAERKKTISEKEAIERAVLIPGVVRWLQYFKVCAIPQAVASSNSQNFIEKTVRRLEIHQYFNALVSAEGLASKPDPAVFLEAARLLNAAPHKCLVVEDAIAGVEGARRAGMKCLAVATGNSVEVLSGADLVIADFDSLQVEQLLQLMA